MKRDHKNPAAEHVVLRVAGSIPARERAATAAGATSEQRNHCAVHGIRSEAADTRIHVQCARSGAGARVQTEYSKRGICLAPRELSRCAGYLRAEAPS